LGLSDEPFTLSWTAISAAAAMNGSLNGKHAPGRIRRRAARTAALAIGLLVLATAAFGLGYDRLSVSQLLPGTRIGGVKVGSRTIAEAVRLLDGKVVQPLRTNAITLRAHDTLRTSAWDLGVRIDTATAVRRVFDAQQSGSLATRLWRRAFGDDVHHSLLSTIDRRKLDSYLDETAKHIDRAPKDATVEVEGAVLRVIPHEVGRRLNVDEAGRRLLRALEAGDRDVRLPVEITQPALRSEQFAKVVMVHLDTNKLDLYNDGKLSKVWPVATGTPGNPTPRGQFKITAKRTNPTWVNPWADWSMDMPARIGPGPNNPLGTRALNLSASGIRIHGTPHADSIGGPASHGCIRMYMEDAEELFDLVDVGTPVLIVGL
jgi:lipoprotein-anchoring transpeptidase ErfK/SrfK